MKFAKPWILSIAVLLAATCPAQGYRKYEDLENGFRLKVPRFLEQQPLEPLEEQILAKFSGKREAKWKGRKREMDLQLLVVRIQRGAAPAAEGAAAEKAPPKSRREAKRQTLNGGTTIEEFLKRHGLVSQKRLRNALERPVKSWTGEPFDIYEVSSRNSAELVVRAFTVETPGDIFGLFAVRYVEAFEPQILVAAKSLERFASESTSADGDTADLYAGSELADIERRRKVRAALVDGWEAHDTDNFILVTNIRSKRLISDMLTDLEVMRGEYIEHFPPAGELTAVSTVRVCASYPEYLAYGAPEGTGGYWHPIDEELVLFDPGKRVPKSLSWLKKLDPKAVLYHEAMHQYLHYANGQVAPAPWFNEGYGEYFGGATVDRRKGEISKIGKNKFRMAWIKTMQKQQAWPDLEDVLRMPKSEFYRPSDALQNYAMGWAVCYFLELERQKKPDDQRKEWALIPATYVQNLRQATERRLKEKPKNAPRDWIQQFKEEIQEDAFHTTFDNLDLQELREAWIDAMRKW